MGIKWTSTFISHKTQKLAQWIIYQNVKAKTIKFLGENIRKALWPGSSNSFFLDMAEEAPSDLQKLKTLNVQNIAVKSKNTSTIGIQRSQYV